MKSALLCTILATNLCIAQECTQKQHDFVDSIEAIHGKTIDGVVRACDSGVLFFADTITKPNMGVIAQDGVAGICDKRKICVTPGNMSPEQSQKWFMEQYEAILSKRST